jgi:hypothetical protein
MIDEVDDVTPALERGVRIVRLKMKAADFVDEHKVTVVVGRRA